jgi:hypothetical protein
MFALGNCYHVAGSVEGDETEITRYSLGSASTCARSEVLGQLGKLGARLVVQRAKRR